MRIHFIGIGGVSMSGLAILCRDKGYEVFGSDFKETETTNHLKSLGINITIGHKEENINEKLDIVVYTAAISKENPELKKAFILSKKSGLKVVDRAKFLGEVMKEYKQRIAVAGTHGKTSTTSMISVLFELLGLNPTISVGGNLPLIGGNFKIGKKDYFITEACEYVDSFLKFYPSISIINNIEADHLDYFKDLDSIKKSFIEFANLTPKDGIVIVNGDDENIASIIKDIKSPIKSFGQKNSNDYIIKEVKFDDMGCASFDLYFSEKLLNRFTIKVPGMHNVYNATASIICALFDQIDIGLIKETIEKYQGVKRRFEKIGIFNGANLIDDYAHHPTEIESTLSACEKISKERLIVAFQPHTYSRTKNLLEEFSKAFDKADEVIITDIYAARETDTLGVHSLDLVEKLKKRGIKVRHISKLEDVIEYAKVMLKPNDLFLSMGAGDIYKVVYELAK